MGRVAVSRMSTASGNISIVIIDPRLLGIDRVEVCNECAHGTHLAPEHISGELQCGYLSVDCPLCGRTALKTRARVRRSPTSQP
jgi:hypothetical protein